MEILEIGEKLDVKYNSRNVCYGIVIKDGKILVSYSPKNQTYSLPGGGIEEGETPFDAIKREFMEEIGYEVVNAEHLVDVHCYWNTHAKFQYVERYTNIMLVEINEVTKVEAIENWHTIHWLSIDEALKILPFPYQKAGIEYYLKNYKN